MTTQNKVIATKALLSEFNGFLNRISGVYSNITGVDKYELFGEGNVALLKAANDFNSARSESFVAYARYIIIDALNECVRKNKVIVAIPRYIVRANQIINRIKKLLNYDDNLFHLVYTGKFETADEELRKDIATEVKLLESAASRAKTALDTFVERVEFLPAVTGEDCITNEMVADTDAQKKIIAELFVRQIKQKLVDNELKVAEYLMDGLSIAAISKATNMSSNKIRGIIVSIRKKVLMLMND